MIGPDTRVADVGSGVGGPAAWLAEHFGAAAGVRRADARRRGGRAAAVRAAHGGRRRRGAAVDVRRRSTPWSASACCARSRGRSDRRLCGSCVGCSGPSGDLGLLVFVARGPLPGPLPEGNDFPTEEALTALLEDAGFSVVQSMESDGLAQAPAAWQERADAVDDLLARRHGDDPRWQRAEEQTARISRLIGGGHVRPLLVHARAAG